MINFTIRTKIGLSLVLAAGCAAFFVSCDVASGKDEKRLKEKDDQDEHEMYDGPMERGMLEFDKLKDPALGTVPVERLWNAVSYTEGLKEQAMYGATSNSIIWTERGPIYDSLGPSNGNGRAGVNYTAGRTAAILVDAADGTGNTVYCGGINGGLWKCTNFLDSVPNWQHINDQFDNMAISSICQDPANNDVMYFSTGEATSNADAVFGRGVWKTTNHGITWTNLASTIGFNRNFKIMCDSRGYVYLATRGFGLRRSTNAGSTWTDITPAGLTAFNPSFCTDIEISSTDKLHASFGYNTGTAGGKVNYRYTTTPATVTTTNWLSGVGIRDTSVLANRLEMAALADTLYAVTTNASNNVDSCYKSIDGGANWTKQNTVAYTANVTNTQGWYDLTLGINPDSSSQFIVAGLDGYISKNSGATVARQTFWVSTAPYVHADHHYILWARIAEENRIIMGTDGGVFLSRDLGRTFKDKNRNLAIKQFYAVAMHPTDPNYLIAGAQDNGTHQLKYSGLGPSTEVTGGDGCFVHINQVNPLVQFGSYVYNQYRRSINGGATWSSINPSASLGLFVNPFDYDDGQNIMYASNAVRDVPNNQIRRWPSANTATATTTVTLSKLVRFSGNSNATAFKVSPFTPNRVFIGGSTGRVIRLDSASTITTATENNNTTDLTSTSFPNGYINCVNTGTSDNNLVAVFTNYGIDNVWVSSNGGLSWTAIDGDLPDMPVRWASFFPGSNSKMVLATEAGIYVTDNISSYNTEWLPSLGFPTVRTDMVKIRTSDNLIAAATHGRGLWTGIFNASLPLYNVQLQGAILSDGNAQLQWKAKGATANTRYQLQYSINGTDFSNVTTVGATVNSYKHIVNATPVSYYRIYATDPNSRAIYSNTVLLRTIKKGSQLSLYPNPAASNASFVLSSAWSQNYTWQLVDMQGHNLQAGKGSVTAGGSTSQPMQLSNLPAGKYLLKVTIANEILTSPVIKQ